MLARILKIYFNVTLLTPFAFNATPLFKATHAQILTRATLLATRPHQSSSQPRNHHAPNRPALIALRAPKTNPTYAKF